MQSTTHWRLGSFLAACLSLCCSPLAPLAARGEGGALATLRRTVAQRGEGTEVDHREHREAPYKAGVASKVITPERSMWMSGYAARNRPSEGKLQDLYVKVLALEDPAGQKLVVLTSDLVGISRELADAVAEEIQRRTGLPRERLLLTVSHTHCGPVIRASLADAYDMSPEEWRKVNAYTDQLRSWMIETIVAALADLKLAKLSYGKGVARFAANRRQPMRSGVALGTNPTGPVDHDVPVLKVEAMDGKLLAVVFGYACHNTTLDFYKWCGDYAGFAQEYLEKKHPGAKAMFWSGCGADANPSPRRSVEICEKHGKELADAVAAVLSSPMTAVQGPIEARFARISLPLDKLPTREKLSAELLDKNSAVRRRAARLLKILDANGKLDDAYRYYPIQLIRVGDQLVWIALGGEVVVDYALRLKKELGASQPVWITAYANDVMAYIPSLRVLKEGGYEADSSMIYYGLPTKWAPTVEEKIIAKVHELATVRAP